MKTVTEIKIIRAYKCNGADGLVIELDGQRVASLISQSDARSLMATRTDAERQDFLALWLGVAISRPAADGLDLRADAAHDTLAAELPNAATHISVRPSQYRGQLQRKVSAYDAARKELGTLIISADGTVRVFAKCYVAAFANAATAARTAC